MLIKYYIFKISFRDQLKKISKQFDINICKFKKNRTLFFTLKYILRRDSWTFQEQNMLDTKQKTDLISKHDDFFYNFAHASLDNMQIIIRASFIQKIWRENLRVVLKETFVTYFIFTKYLKSTCYDLECQQINHMINIHHLVVVITMILYLLGRICDDMSWYQFDGLSENGFESIALGTLTISALLVIIRRANQEDGFKVLFVYSQMKFVIPWSLVILECIFVFNIFECYHDHPEQELQFAMDYKGCCLYSVVLLITNLNYSLMCNVRGDIPLLIVFETVLFAEIIYNGTLLIKFVNNLHEKHKDYSILFVSILIAWQILVMDLIFRTAYEEREKAQRHHRLEQMVDQHHEQCKKLNEEGEMAYSNNRLNIDLVQPEITVEKSQKKQPSDQGKPPSDIPKQHPENQASKTPIEANH